MESIQVSREPNGVVTVTFNRPEKKNAITYPMWGELTTIIREFGESNDDRVLVLTGSGDSFCAGADLSGEMVQGSHHLARMHYINQLPLALHDCPKPTIAKVNGIAAGAGVNLAIGCDLVVASSEARFSEIFAKRGLTVDLGGTWLLPRLIGMHRAKELALFGDIITSTEAERIGLVNHVIPQRELDTFVDDWAGRARERPAPRAADVEAASERRAVLVAPRGAPRRSDGAVREFRVRGHTGSDRRILPEARADLQRPLNASASATCTRSLFSSS